jgi:hypothetical protein
MTLNQVCKRVDYWRSKLQALGISHWSITVSVVDEPQAGRRNAPAAASVGIEDLYDTADIQFRADMVPAGAYSDPDFDRYIVHEMLHVAMRDWDAAIHSVDEHLSPATAAQWIDRLEHEEEGVVDRIARAIVAANASAK